MALQNRKDCFSQANRKTEQVCNWPTKNAQSKTTTKIDDKFESELARLLKGNSQHTHTHTYTHTYIYAHIKALFFVKYKCVQPRKALGP